MEETNSDTREWMFTLADSSDTWSIEMTNISKLITHSLRLYTPITPSRPFRSWSNQPRITPDQTHNQALYKGIGLSDMLPLRVWASSSGGGHTCSVAFCLLARLEAEEAAWSECVGADGVSDTYVYATAGIGRAE